MLLVVCNSLLIERERQTEKKRQGRRWCGVVRGRERGREERRGRWRGKNERMNE